MGRSGARLVGGAAAFHHRDHLASVRVTSNPAGAVAKRQVFRPFGESAQVTGSAPQDGETIGFIGERAAPASENYVYGPDGGRLKRMVAAGGEPSRHRLISVKMVSAGRLRNARARRDKHDARA